MNKIFIQKHKKAITIAAIALATIFIVTVSLFGYGQYYLRHATKNKCESTLFIVNQGEGTRQIVKNLHDSCFIASEWPYLVYLKISGLAGSIQAGEYNLSGNMTPLEITDVLTKGEVASKKITIPEGWTIDDIGTYLEGQDVVTKEDFNTATAKDYDYDFLTDKPVGASLEGYLFPDTYQISVRATAEDIVLLMLDNFGNKLTSETRAAISSSGMNIYETVTLASIVEREVAKPEDRKVVAGIFLNRLNEGMALESCATIQYILKSNEKRFSYEQTRVESPYNTYIYPGLPLGPIGNPGVDSIRAVLFPEVTSFLYFFSSEGTTYYSKTLDEHEEKISQYLD